MRRVMPNGSRLRVPTQAQQLLLRKEEAREERRVRAAARDSQVSLCLHVAASDLIPSPSQSSP